MKNEDKSVLDLLKAYANAGRQIQSAANNRRLTVKQYQKHLNDTVTQALSVLDKKNREFAERDLQTGFAEGRKKTDSHTPKTHGGMTALAAARILRRAGFRYNAQAFGYDTYIELHNATKAAGEGFKERVNKTIEQLKKQGKDTVYNVAQAVKEDIRKQGLLNVEFKGGRKVSVSSYAAMAARSARMESANIGAFGRALENGTDYVRCTAIYPTCEICAKYQGKIYCISGKDKRFPALFETALRSGYALMHPNCRHEFIPVWLELMDEKELAKAIEQSKISPKADTRSEEERDAYAEWQAEHRQRYSEQQYFNQAKQVLGHAMPYKDIAAFRRSYRTREGSFAHQKSHNLMRDYQTYTDYKQVLESDPDFPKTLAKFQEIKYNDDRNYELLKEFKVYKTDGGNNSFRGYKTAKSLADFHVNGKINIPPLQIDTQNIKFDNIHINQERSHGVSLEEAKKYISQATVSITVWKGKYERYYSSEGVVYLDKETMNVRTAFKKDEFDERTKKIIEVVEKDE